MLIWLLCLSSAAAAASRSSQCPSLVARLSFHRFRQCPTQHAALLLNRLTSELQCVAICSRLRTCNAFHFNISTGQCYHGDACSRLEQWTDGHCNSYKYTDVLCRDCDVQKPELTELGMKLFYKFSRSGLQNEVNPRRFCLKAQNATVDAKGAHFEGHNGSYLSTETPEFHKLIAYGSEYSAFLRVRHVFDDGQTTYFSFLNRDDPSSAGSMLQKRVDNIFSVTIFKQLTNSGTEEFGLLFNSTQALPVDNARHELSFGIAFNGTTSLRFYTNGSTVEVGANSKTASLSYSKSLFDSLRLGYGPINAKSLNGTLLCYGFGSKALSPTEFQRLELMCNKD